MIHSSAADSSGESATRQGVLPPNLSSTTFDDILPTTKISTFNPPRLPSFADAPDAAAASTADAADALREAPLETRKPKPTAARATSWNTKPGGWWMSLTAMVQGKKAPAIIVSSRWTRARVGVVASVSGVVVIALALVLALVALGLGSSAEQRDALAVAVLAGRVVVALAIALFGWGLVRLGERLTARVETVTRSATPRTP